MSIRRNGYKRLINRVSRILKDNPQDIVDDQEGLIYTGGLWELVAAREIDLDDESIEDVIKEEILDNPRKIGSANLMYVHDLIEKYCVNNPSSLARLPKTSNVVSIEECVKSFTTHVINELVEDKIVRVMPHIKREQSIRLVVDNTRKESANVAVR
tara:strand:+ start:8190 stop:8657 length:468 start_codon:yes stop_codon:yes gene_type:complete